MNIDRDTLHAALAMPVALLDEEFERIASTDGWEVYRNLPRVGSIYRLSRADRRTLHALYVACKEEAALRRERARGFDLGTLNPAALAFVIDAIANPHHTLCLGEDDIKGFSSQDIRIASTILNNDLMWLYSPKQPAPVSREAVYWESRIMSAAENDGWQD